MIRLLLKKKADPNISFNGRTPLMEASANGSVNMVQLLLLYGANVLTEDAEGKNAIDWAKDSKIKDILKYYSAEKASLIGLERQWDEDLSMVSSFLKPKSNGSIDALAEVMIAFPSIQALISQAYRTDIESVEVGPSTYAMRRCSRNSDSD